jgi:hypothetical protein
MSRIVRTRSSRFWAAVAAAALLGGPIALAAQDAAVASTSFTVTGSIRDTEDKTPLQYAVIGIPEMGSWDLSKADGSFSLELSAPGMYRLLVIKRGWYLAESTVTIAGPAPIDVQLFKERAEDPVGPGRLVGRVFDAANDRGLSGITVRVTPTNQETRTDSRGRFLISGISAGALLVEVSGRDYAPRADTLVAIPGITLAAAIGVSKDRAQRPPLTVEEYPRYLESVGFYRRAETPRGARFALAFMESQGTRRMSDVVSNAVTSVRIEPIRSRRVLTVRGSGGDRCALGIWYDGNPMPGFDVDMLSADQIMAFEVYERMDVPLEYRDSCGVLLLWSRRP